EVSGQGRGWGGLYPGRPVGKTGACARGLRIACSCARFSSVIECWHSAPRRGLPCCQYGSPMSFVKSRKHTAPAYPAACPLAAFADEGVTTPDGSRATTTLDEVEVHGEKVMSYTGERTSPKFDKPLVDTTRTVQVIGEDLFDEQAATTLSEALRNAAGVGTFYAGENGNTTTGDAVFMRGFDASSSIFVDGVRDLGSISRDVFNLQQVEV